MPVQNCSTCNTPLPGGASFCPTCGVATPTEVRQATGETFGPSGSVDEAEYRIRLQRAIGEGYRLGDLIGRGGFGVVYSAWDIDLDREVAVKALRHDLVPTSGLIQRFKREARAAAKLRHANITPIYAVGEGEGIAYMIMPRLVGENLKSVVVRGEQLPVSDVQRILVEAAHALSAAHQAGIVHRDIKPENIFLEGDERRVYLMDFGIAKALDTDEEGLTGTGMIVGTPSYMSPEQAGGQGGIDSRADIYSLGVLGYQLLTGRLPYSADSLQDLIFQQITKQPEELQKIRPEIPGTLASAVERCLRTDPDERWRTAEELAEAIEGKRASAGRSRHKQRRALFIAAPLVVVALGVAGYMAVQAGSTPGEDQPLPITGPPRSAEGPSVAADDPRTEQDSGAAAVELASLSTAQDTITATQPAADEVAAPGQAGPRDPVPVVSGPERQPAPQPPPVGYLTVNADMWGMVAVDGVDVQTTPLTRHELAPGTYVITVWRDGFRSWADTVEITAGNVVRRRATLIRVPQ